MDNRMMLKSRRDTKVLNAAWKNGYKAGLEGTTVNPYAGRIPHFAEQWDAGFAAAQQDLSR